MAPEKLTAAHKSLAFGSLVRVTDLDTGKRVDVIINDRGPFVRGRIIDLSFAAARDLGVVEKGVARVRIEVIGLAGPLAERRWRVQAGSFEAEARAQELLTALQTQGHGPVLLTEFENEGALYHRVWVGSFRERDAAERLLRQLQLQGFSGFVILAAATSP
jgi:rare lipoprotein A